MDVTCLASDRSAPPLPVTVIQGNPPRTRFHNSKIAQQAGLHPQDRVTNSQIPVNQ